MAKNSVSKMDRCAKIKNAKIMKERVEEVVDIGILDLDNYTEGYPPFDSSRLTADQKQRENDNLDDLAMVFEILEPKWKIIFNAVEAEKSKKFADPKLDDNVRYLSSLVDPVKKSDHDNASVSAMNMFLANKIAHCLGDARQYLVLQYFTDTEGEYLNEKSAELSELVATKFKWYYNAKKTNQTKRMENLKRDLNRLGITQKHIQELEEKYGLEDITLLEIDAFAIKDFEMESFIKKVQERDRLHKEEKVTEDTDERMSYGLGFDDEKNECLIVDLPFYGQFAVHMKSEKLISSLSQTIYTKAFIGKDKVLLTQGRTPVVKEDLKKSNGTAKSIKATAKERLIKEPSSDYTAKDYAHQLAVKSGARKQDLDDLYI